MMNSSGGLMTNPEKEVDRLVAEYAIPRGEARRLWYNQHGGNDA